MTLMLHNYRSRQFHRTSNGINPSSGSKDMGSAKSGPSAAWFDKFLADGQTHVGQITMAVHNYRSRQVRETLNGVNPSSGFRDMRSAKSRPNLWQIWQVFGPWASPYGANGQMSMTVHNYRPRQFHRTSNGENPSSGYRDMGSASLAAARPTARPPARQSARPPARPPGPWRQYPSSPEGWGVTNFWYIGHPTIKRRWLWDSFISIAENCILLQEPRVFIYIYITRAYIYISWSTLAQVMAWCLMAPSHYLNQCWLIIKDILWHTPNTDFTEGAQDMNSWNEFEK